MTTAINKSTVTLSGIYKSSGPTLIWNNATQTWDDITGTWDSPGQTKTEISKATITKSAITKST